MLTASDLGMAEEEAELLSIAAIYDQIDILNDLLNAEVHGNVHSRDKWGLTPLHHAARNGSYKCVELLLQRDADPDARSYDEDNLSTPLHHAAKIKNVRCIQLLLDYGANLDVRNIHGKTAMDVLQHHADAQECISYINSVIERRRMEQEVHKREELYDVIEAGSFKQAKEILESIENKEDAINRYCKGPNTLLFKASYGGHPHIVKLLLDNGANGRPNGGTGLTPLYAACFVGNLEVVKILVERLPNLLMQPNKSDRSVPLHAAIMRGNIEVLGYLLSLRKEVENVEPIPKRRSSSTRKSSGKEDQMNSKTDTSVLDVNFLNSEDISPLHVAVVYENKEAVLELLNCKPILKGHVVYPHPSCLMIDIPGKLGETPLLFAIHNKNVEIARMLLLNGADPNRSDPNPEALNPLQSACQSNCKEMVKLLLDHGANPNLFNQEKLGSSPLCIACHQDNVSMVKLLLEFGAKDVSHAACLEAISKHRDHIVDLFLETGVFEEADSQLQETESNLTSVRIFWTKRKLSEVREKWIINAVIRKNMNVFFRKKMAVEESLQKDNSVVCNLITKLDLSGNELKNVPVLLFQLPSLRKLTLADNEIHSLPCAENRIDSSNETLSGETAGEDSGHMINGSLKYSNGEVKIRPVSWDYGRRLPKKEVLQTSSRPVSASVSDVKEPTQENQLPFEKTNEDESRSPDSPINWDWNCPFLEELELQKNELKSVPKCVFELPCLKVLNLYRNKIKELPLELWTAPSLKDVLLQENELTCLPSHASSRKSQKFPRPNLRVDEVDARRANTADNGPGNTVKSKRPSWDGESSDESDEEDGSMEKFGLYKLDISYNKEMKALPLHLPCLAPNLCKLTAASCSIQGTIFLSQLPPGLTMLDLSRNQIKKFDATGNEPAMDRSCFSPSHAALKKSASVSSAMNRPRQAKKFCHHRSHRVLLRLKNINLSQNNLETLQFVTALKPHSKAEVFDCAFPELQTLTLASNALTCVPTHVGKIRKLLSLDISDNPKIDTLPPELGLCSHLYDLKFNAQNIREPPKAIVEKRNPKGQVDVHYIRNFLKGVCEQSRPYPTIKLMLVGHSGKGKSTLLQNLRREGTGAYQDPEYPIRFTERMRDEPPSPRGKASQDESTVGVDVCDWTYQRKHIIGGSMGPEIKFSTWDFAGQEEYYATHTCFLSRRAIYLLVWKLTDGMQGIDQLQGWLLNIQARASDSSVIIVGTHYDEIPNANRRNVIDRYRKIIYKRYVSDKLGGGMHNLLEKGLPRVIAVTEVSSKAKSEYNIRELRFLIYEKVLSLRNTEDGILLEALVPASYLEVEKAVLSIAKRFAAEKKYSVLDTKQFKANVREEMKVNEMKEIGDDQLDNAVKFLHDCGVLLHFDGPALEDLYFIDPQWLCDMLANVITIRDVNPFIKNGVLKVDDLKNMIFKGQRFPSSHVKKYIQLMNKFEVALQISSHYLLVPSLLPEKQSESPEISSKLCEEIRTSMKMEAYRKKSVFRRQYRMAYVPSGFWARLITRLIADNRIGKTVTMCSEFTNVENETAEKIKYYKESLVSAAPPEWACWRTGVELSCFGVKLLRVCQLAPNELFFGHDVNRSDKVFLSDSIYHGSRTPLIEILVPCARLFIEVDTSDHSSEKIGYKVVSVKDSYPQTSCELLALTAEHFDNLMTDWFPDLDSQNIHGEKTVQRLGLCPECLSEKLQKDEASEENGGLSNPKGQAENQGPVDGKPKQDSSKENGKGSKKGQGTEAGGTPRSKRKQAGKKKQRAKSDKEANKETKVKEKATTELKTEDGENIVKADKNECDTNVDSATKHETDLKEGANTQGDVRNRSNSGTETGQNKEEQKEDNVIKDDAEQDISELEKLAKESINGFEFEDALKRIDAHESIRCAVHGIIGYEKIFPDLVFSDLPDGIVYDPEQIKIEKFIAAGSYGAVFKASLEREGKTIEIAVKVPNNTDVGNTKNVKARLDAEKNKKIKEGALTLFTTGVYTAIRQELSILVPVSHKHVLDFIGVGLSPLRLLVEFAPKGSLDSVLSDYKTVGRKLSPYTMQQCIIQVSSALDYLHEQSIIYRDLKSENVLVWLFPEPGNTTDSTVNLKLADYGISRSVAVAGMKGLLGTPGFIAPEIIKYRGKESYSKKVDSFSFGSFIYELISQELPFQKYGGGQADQLMVDNKRPRLTSGDKRIPIPILSLLYKCWEQDPQDRPSSAEINAFARLPEFPRLFDDLECEDSFRLQSAVTSYKARTNAIIATADTKTVIGTELWLLSNDGKQSEKEGRTGNVTVLHYADGKCAISKKMELNDIVLVACAVGSTIWIGMRSGAIKVYCSMTYKPLALGRASGSGSIISILHSPACHCVLIGLTNDCIMSYNEHISAYMHTIPQNEIEKHFGNVSYRDPIKELIANKVHPGNSVYNPIHCLAAVPSRARSHPIEDVMTYFDSGGEPMASSSREHKYDFDAYARDGAKKNVITYELWCGVDKGLINIFALNQLEKVQILAATGCEVDNPTIRNQSVKCIETRRMFHNTGNSNLRANVPKGEDDVPVSVWVAVFPGTHVYRWNVDERKLEAKIDTLACSTDRELNSIKHPSRQRVLLAPQAQINTILVVENELYIGTSFGCLIVCESMSLNPLFTTRCFSERLDYIVPLQMMLNSRGNTGRNKEKLILCSGRGCLDKWNRGKRKRPADKTSCTILSWYADQWVT